ncbi:ankyrin repeat-containing domain protein [Catenaria anguillulae PL171]|uniref:Ankyrin repeat-containing domain protein n=1 Tax=Catenaria anguillulae PL171 TaxID=765915 RepID=A0A1Y2HI78_9FUNG|nr:ankyrin repeat-containing domain protein [Catenaria anguillulae PL171]
MSPPPNTADASGPSGSSRRLRRDRSTPTPVPSADQQDQVPDKEQAQMTKGKENKSTEDDQELAARLNRLRSTANPSTTKRPAVKVPTPPVISAACSSRSRLAASSDNDNDNDNDDGSDSDDSITPNQSLSQPPSSSSAPQVDLTALISTIHANIDSPSPSTLAALSTAVSSIPTSTPPASLPANHPRRTPLHSAIMRKNPQAIAMLLSNPAIANAWANMADRAGITPLVLCLRSKKTFNMDSLRALLGAGASAFGPAMAFAAGDAHTMSKAKKPAAAPDTEAFTPLDVLAWAMQHITADADAGVFDRIVADARKHGVLDQVTNEGYGALHLAVNLGSPGHVKSLLDVGAMDPSSSRNRKWPVVHFAACNNQVSALHLLLDAGCPANLPALDGQTPLHAAAAAGHLAVIDFLLAQGADATIRDKNGWMPITWALDALCKRGRTRPSSPPASFVVR